MALRLELLADHPESVGTVTSWYWDQWGRHDAGMTRERIHAKVSGSLGRKTAPLIVLAMEGEEPIGAAEFKLHEMSIYPDFEHWLGGVYVRDDHRGRGVAARLVEEVLARARAAGADALHLQTEKHDGGLYARLGFESLERVRYKGHDVLVMRAQL